MGDTITCTAKGSQMVEYALSGMDNQLFVSDSYVAFAGQEEARRIYVKRDRRNGNVKLIWKECKTNDNRESHAIQCF